MRGPGRGGYGATRHSPAPRSALTCEYAASKPPSASRWTEPQPAQTRPPGRPTAAFGPIACKQRNAVERAFGRLHQHRAAATWFDKRDFAWRATVDVASIRIWLRDSVP